ncbi:MAG TPA: SAM-dependent chlorinase/fluorinase [Bacteroidales bacterium]|jgi:S-adenosylmethionine hydrolase|nr:SAM-dependent chlorinase/fluorinase [Bacteroidales bacterium]
MPIVVFICDWKNDDYYRAMVDGMLYSVNPDLKVTYATTHIDFNDIFQAALILRLALYTYPDNTFFIVSVKTVVNQNEGYIYANINNKHVFCANNGILGFIDAQSIQKIYQLPYEDSTFPEKDIFVPAIEYLLNNNGMENWGTEIRDVNKAKKFYPDFSNNIITGMVIYIDSYGNAITNISKSFFNKCKADKNFVIYPNTKHERITKISTSYTDLEGQDFFAVFNSLDLLEIGVFEGNISQLYHIKLRTNITIEIV